VFQSNVCAERRSHVARPEVAETATLETAGRCASCVIIRAMGVNQFVPAIIALLFRLVPLILGIVAFMALIRIRNAAEETNRRLAAIEAKLTK
jgi:hypothetical protein